MSYKDPEKNKQYHQEYYKKNKEKIRLYMINWEKDNIERVRENQRKWRKKHPGYSTKYRYRGMRDKILNRDNHECQICGQKENLHIHHYNKNRKDNSYWNLLTLCPTCHRLHHTGKF